MSDRSGSRPRSTQLRGCASQRNPEEHAALRSTKFCPCGGVGGDAQILEQGLHAGAECFIVAAACLSCRRPVGGPQGVPPCPPPRTRSAALWGAVVPGGRRRASRPASRRADPRAASTRPRSCTKIRSEASARDSPLLRPVLSARCRSSARPAGDTTPAGGHFQPLRPAGNVHHAESAP
jgi:hypothetical protein